MKGDKEFCKSMGGSFDKSSVCREGKCILRECLLVGKSTSVKQVVQHNVNCILQWILLWGSALVSPFDILRTNSVVCCGIFE